MKRIRVIGLFTLALMALMAPALAQADDAEIVAATDVVFDLAWIGLVIAFFLPLVTSFLKRNGWSNQTKRVFAFGIAAVAGIVNTGVQAGWQFDNASTFASLAAFSVIDVYVAAAVIYRNFWEDTGIESSLASVGDNTGD